MTSEQVEKLISYGQLALEQGWYDQAREYFDQALELDASNREAMKGLAQVNEILSRERAAAPIEAKAPTDTSLVKRISDKADSALEWIRKKHRERADRITEQKKFDAKRGEIRARQITQAKTGEFALEGSQERNLESRLHHLEMNWVCPRCKRQSKHVIHTAVSRVDCPSCNREYQIVIGHVVGFWVTSIPSWLPFTPWDWACTLRIKDLDGVQRNVRFIVTVGSFTPQPGDLVLISYKRQKPKLIQNYTAREYCSVQNR